MVQVLNFEHAFFDQLRGVDFTDAVDAVSKIAVPRPIDVQGATGIKTFPQASHVRVGSIVFYQARILGSFSYPLTYSLSTNLPQLLMRALQQTLSKSDRAFAQLSPQPLPIIA